LQRLYSAAVPTDGRARGIEPAHGPFLVCVLDATIYPNVPVWLVVRGAVIVCTAILGIYGWRYLRRTTDGQC
jgi:hypothetical protein